MVEAQHLISTRKLVDSSEEQELLERVLDHQKPSSPNTQEAQHLHYLLSTPFRYPPLSYGSRFGTRSQRGIWYGSEKQHTAFAEAAYYRLLFLEGTDADLGELHVTLTLFQVRAQSRHSIDLTTPPFNAHGDHWTSPNHYHLTQALGSAMRNDGVEILRYRSARDPKHGNNVALLQPHVLRGQTPNHFQTWLCVASRNRIEFSRKDFFEKGEHTFPRETFLVDQRLPQPAP